MTGESIFVEGVSTVAAAGVTARGVVASLIAYIGPRFTLVNIYAYQIHTILYTTHVIHT